MSRVHTVMAISGSDSISASGIQADIKTISSLGCNGLCAVTAITAQKIRSVETIYPVPAPVLQAQIRSTFSDVTVDAIKIGMVASQENIKTIASEISFFPKTPVILDTPITSTSNQELLSPEGISLLVSKLIPKSTLITPNVVEAEILIGEPIDSSKKSVTKALKKLCELGSKAVLLKGGHFDDTSSKDYLFKENKITVFSSERIKNHLFRGTGCTLSSAIACFLSHGKSLEESVALAKQYVTNTIKKASRWNLDYNTYHLNHFYKEL